MKKPNKDEIRTLYKKLTEQTERNIDLMSTVKDINHCPMTLSGNHEWIPNPYYKQTFIFGLHFLQIWKCIKTVTRCVACNKIRN